MHVINAPTAEHNRNGITGMHILRIMPPLNRVLRPAEFVKDSSHEFVRCINQITNKWFVSHPEIVRSWYEWQSGVNKEYYALPINDGLSASEQEQQKKLDMKYEEAVKDNKTYLSRQQNVFIWISCPHNR